MANGEPCWTRTSDPLLKRPHLDSLILLIQFNMYHCAYPTTYTVFPHISASLRKRLDKDTDKDRRLINQLNRTGIISNHGIVDITERKGMMIHMHFFMNSIGVPAIKSKSLGTRV
jgi:hypothetical protein